MLKWLKKVENLTYLQPFSNQVSRAESYIPPTILNVSVKIILTDGVAVKENY